MHWVCILWLQYRYFGGVKKEGPKITSTMKSVFLYPIHYLGIKRCPLLNKYWLSMQEPCHGKTHLKIFVVVLPKGLDWRAGFFWYDTYYRFIICSLHGLYFKVGPRPPILFLIWLRQRSEGLFSHDTAHKALEESCHAFYLGKKLLCSSISS